MDNSYITLERIGEGTYEEKKSVFIGVAYPVETEEEALEVIRAHKKKYYDARHNCYAYVLKDGVTQRFSDDGEPQGSAGLPMLNVLT
jgi:putative IMPACT (imprinted ancient) family translation regulator